MRKYIAKKLIHWINEERPNKEFPECDYERIRYELRPCDVLLVEGRSRVSEVIKIITQSPWSHSCLYIGKIHDIDDTQLREILLNHFSGEPDVQLVIEGILGKGTIITPLEHYKADHIRLCRPKGLSRKDAQQVLSFAIHKLGTGYDIRQLFDLGRFLLPWSILPRRWQSSLFEHNLDESAKTVCSTMIAEAFASINFPILPVIKRGKNSHLELFIRNPKLFTPRDFDYSPYFDIIKFPFVTYEDSHYRNLPWNREGCISHDGENISYPKIHDSRMETKSPSIEPKEKHPSNLYNVMTMISNRFSQIFNRNSIQKRQL